MIELNIESKNLVVKELYIKELNHVCVTNYFNLYYFMESFVDGLSNIYIGNCKLDKKNLYVINLLDYESIYNQLTLKKGSLLYDYLIDEINEKVEDSDIKEKVEALLNKLVDESLNERTLKYDVDFDIDMEKLISSYIHINIDLKLENDIKIIKQLINRIKEKNIKKHIMVFVNTNIFLNDLDSLNDVYIFKFYSNAFPNILINEEIQNVDLNLLMNQIKLNWPCEITNETINIIIKEFFNDYIYRKKKKCDDYIKYIGYILICRVMMLKNINIQYNGNIEDVPIIYKKYIESLKF